MSSLLTCGPTWRKLAHTQSCLRVGPTSHPGSSGPAHGLFVSLVYCAESTVRWFVVREKYCWMTADSADKSKRTGDNPEGQRPQTVQKAQPRTAHIGSAPALTTRWAPWKRRPHRRTAPPPVAEPGARRATGRAPRRTEEAWRGG
jgi:hypothetical protein